MYLPAAPLYPNASTTTARGAEARAIAIPDDWTEVYGAESASGEVVSASSAKTLSAVWRAVSIITRTISRLPIRVVRRAGDLQTIDRRHAAWSILRRRPNAYHTPSTFKMVLIPNLLLHGNAYAVIVRDERGRPTELIPLNATDCSPMRVRGKLIYSVVVRDDEFIFLDHQSVLHLRGIGDDLLGDSLVARARDSLGLGISQQKYGARFFKNGAVPPIVLQHPSRLTPEAAKRLRDSWQSAYGGTANAGRAAVLWEGMTANTISLSNVDSQYLESREFHVREVANWFGVPPHLLGDTERTSYNSLEQENQAFLDGIDGWLCPIEDELNAKLLATDELEGDTHHIEFDRSAFVRANQNDRYSAYATAIQLGWMSRDEARAREGLNPIPDGEGEKFLVPVNLAEAGGEGAADGGPPVDDVAPVDEPDDEPDDRLAPVWADVRRRVYARFEKQAARAAKDVDRFAAFRAAYAEKEHAAIAAIAAPACEAAGVELEGVVARYTVEIEAILESASTSVDVAGTITREIQEATTWKNG